MLRRSSPISRLRKNITLKLKTVIPITIRQSFKTHKISGRILSRHKHTPHKLGKPKQLVFNQSCELLNIKLSRVSSWWTPVFWVPKLTINRLYIVWVSCAGIHCIQKGQLGVIPSLTYSINVFYEANHSAHLIGQVSPISCLQHGFVVSDIRWGCSRLASSPGAYGIIQNPFFSIIKLPSTVVKSLPGALCYIGKLWGQRIKMQKFSGVSLHVRGIAKNPVDHPNGGRANTKGSFKTPWGFWAKKNK